MEKLKRTFTKTTAVVLAVILLVGSAPLSGFVGLDFSGLKSLFSFEAEAATSGYLTYKIENGGAVITGHTEDISGDFVIPSVLGGYPVTKIDDDAFEKCTGLISITIPNSVTSIGDHAFSGCVGLTSVTIPDGVTSIGWGAFSDCADLTSVTIGKSVKSIDNWAFSHCASLTNITVNENNLNYSSLDGVLFSKNKMTLITYPAGKTNSSYVIPNSVTSIGYAAFSDCYVLTNITIPDSVTNIDNWAFYGCTGLTSLIIPDSVINIGGWAFENCTGLASVKISNHLMSIEQQAFDGCIGLKNISIPNSVTNIGDYAFRNTGLVRITISNSVTSIGEGAFANCTDLISIIIYDSVKSIYADAFWNCANLKIVYYVGSEEQWKKISIGDSNSCLTDAKIIYNSHGPNGNSQNTNANSSTNKLLDTGNLIITPYPQDVKSVVESKLEGATVSWNSKSETTKEKVSVAVPKSEINGDIRITEENHRDYIIPEKVAAMTLNYPADYSCSIYMTRKDSQDCYISSVIGRNDKDIVYPFVDLKCSSVECTQGETATIYVTSCGLKDPTYYISQDNTKKISSKTGEFSSVDVYGKFDFGATIVAYAVGSDGKTTQPVKIKLEKKVRLSNSVKALENMTTMNLLGSSGMGFSISDDFPILGGSEIDFSAFKCPVGVEINGTDVKISLGFDFFESKKNYETGDIEKEWKGFKDGCKGVEKTLDGFDDSYDNWYKKWNSLDNLKKQYSGKNIIKTGAADKDRGWTCSFLGYIEGKLTDDGKICFKEGSVMASAEFKYKYSQQTAVWVIPAYYYFELGAEISLEGNVYKLVPDRSCPIDWAVTLGVEPKVAVGGGAGIVDFASVGLRGEGSVPIKLEFRKGHLTIDLKGALYAEGQLLFIKGKKKIIDGETNVLDRNLWGTKKSIQRFLLSPNHEFFAESELNTVVSVMDRDYLKKTSSWRGSSSNVKKAPSKAASTGGIRFADLQTSVYNQSQPQVVNVGGKQVMVYVADDGLRDEYNRLCLMYSVNDNGTWSTPKAVYDDGNNDASPSLSTDGSKVYVSWQKVAKKLTAADCQNERKMLENMEICLAEFNSDTNKFESAKRISNNSVYDYLPFTVVESGTASVYYAEGDPASEKNAIVRYADGTNRTVKTGLPYVNALSATADEVSYSIDKDIKNGLTSDISVFTVKNGQTAEFGKYADENFSSANSPYNQLTYGELDGNNTLFVSDGTSVYYKKDEKTIRAFSTVSSISGYLQSVKTDDGLTLLWVGYNDDSTEIFSCSYRNGVWGEPVQISSQGDVISFLSADYVNGTIRGVCNITESNFDETAGDYDLGQTNLTSFVIGGFSDLSVSAFAPDETTLKSGEKAFINTYVTQNGTEDVTGLDIKVTDTLGTEMTYHKDIDIKSGTTVNFDIPYTVPKNYKGTTVTVSVSTGVSDKNESDNTAKFKTGNRIITINDKPIEEFDDVYILPLRVENYTSLDIEDLTLTYSIEDYDESKKNESVTLTLDTLVEDSYNDVRIAVRKKALAYDENGCARINVSVRDGENEISSLVTLIEKTSTKCHHPMTEKKSGISATCTENGKTAGVYCKVCKKYASGGEKISALGHNIVNDKAVAPTCTKKGKTAGKHCLRCGTVTVAQKSVSATGHKYKTTTAKATTSKDGSVITKCTTCQAIKAKSAVARIASVKLSNISFTYNGKAQKPSVTVKDRTGKVLKNGTDYTVRYSNGCKDVGRYNVTVTFKGNYSGTKTLTFNIIPKGTSISKLTAGKKQFTAKWSKQTAQTTGYELQYSVSSRMSGANTVTVGKNKTTSSTVKKLKKGKKYYARVRTYKTVKINGKSVKIYSGWSKIKSVKTK